MLELAGLGVVAAAFGCGPKPAFVLGAGERLDAETIDRDPIALLPPGAIMLGSLDLEALYKTPIGGDVNAIVESLVPLGRESNFVPSRDTRKLVGGVWAMKGVDLCAVTQGSFDVQAIQRAADARAQAPSGAPLVKTRYADVDLYTVGNLGFVLLTPSTMLSGNEVGMRRALDRLRTKKPSREVAPWMIELFDTPGASFAIAGDFGAESAVEVDAFGLPRRTPRASARTPVQPVLEAVSKTYPFLAGVRAVRVLGNFNPPGLNFAGALTYESEEAALAGSGHLKNLSQLTQWINLLAAFGVGASLPPAQLAPNGKDVGGVQPVDTQFAKMAISIVARYLRRG